MTLNHNGTALKLIQQLWVSHDHTMMPVVPLASPLSGTTVCVHKFEREQGSPACGSSWVGGLTTKHTRQLLHLGSRCHWWGHRGQPKPAKGCCGVS